MALSRPSGNSTDLRLVLVGKTGAGKSKTGNTILDHDLFRSVAEASSVTGKCQLGQAYRFGRRIQIIDTPGLFDTGLSQEEVANEIRKCVAMSAPGPHAIILVTAIGRFTKEDSDTVEFFRMMFGEGVLNHLIVLFTRRDDLDDEGISIEDYLTRIPDNLKKLLRLCGRHYVAFNNKAPPEGQDKQVRQLLHVLDNMIDQNGGGFYTTEMFRAGEEFMQKEEEELRRRYDEEQRQLTETVKENKFRQQNMTADFKRETQEMTGKMAALQSGQRQGDGGEAARLQEELEELKQLVVAMKESHEQERRRQAEEIKQQEARLAQKPPDFREAAQREVCEETSGVTQKLMGAFGFLIDSVLPKVAEGLGMLVTKVFKKVAKKI